MHKLHKKPGKFPKHLSLSLAFLRCARPSHIRAPDRRWTDAQIPQPKGALQKNVSFDLRGILRWR